MCKECRTHIKAIDLRRTELQVLLPLERVMSLDTDRQAKRKDANLAEQFGNKSRPSFELL